MPDLDSRLAVSSRAEVDVIIDEPSLSWNSVIEFGPITRRTIGLRDLNCRSCNGTHNDIEILRDYTVATFHAFLTWENGELQISDAVASTGTFINGRRLERGERSLLTANDEVRVGQTVITIAKVDGDNLRVNHHYVATTVEEPVLV